VAAKKILPKGPMTAEDIRHSIELTRRLVTISSDQIRQAKLDLDLATTNLAELDDDLRKRGLDLT
jgi:hypothetical protein